MPVPAAINQASAVGMEITPGTAAARTKRFSSFGLSKSRQYNIGKVRPPGSKYATKHYLSGEWSEFGLDDGVLSYDEVIYPLAGILRKTTPTTPTGAVTARRWLFDSSTFARDDVQTYTVESGDVAQNRGGVASHGVFTEWSFEVSRSGDTTEMGGEMMARKLESAAMTASELVVEDFMPVVPSQWNLYLDTDAASLGNTQIENAFEVGFEIGDRRSPVWFLNRAISSFSSTVEAVPSTEINLMVADEADPVDDILQGLRVGDRLFLRAEALGPQIEAGHNFRFTADFACQVSDAPEDDEEDDAQVVNLTLEAEHDGDWGKAFQIAVVNDRATL